MEMLQTESQRKFEKLITKISDEAERNQVMPGELTDLVSGIAMGEQGDKAKDILGRIFLLHYVLNGTIE